MMQRPWFLPLIGSLAGCGLVPAEQGARQEAPSQRGLWFLARPEARAQTAPVPHSGDVAEDAAVWIHPDNPALSLVLGTDDNGALHTYNMDGTPNEMVGDGTWPAGVDVLYGFPLDGRAVDLAVAAVQINGRPGLIVWVIDPATRRLSDVTHGGRIEVFGGGTPSGVCGYKSGRNGRHYVFVTNVRGEVEQRELWDGGGGTVAAIPVRTFDVGSAVESCVADDELADLYVAEAAVGIWRFSAEPNGADKKHPVALVGEYGLAADVEGLAIYYGPLGQAPGYLIAASQGNNTFLLYERAGGNRFVGIIDPKAGAIDDVNDVEGIAVTGCATSPQFGGGVFIAKDGDNASGNQNFKLYAWEDIAGTQLLSNFCRRG
jgi:3-phytase